VSGDAAGALDGGSAAAGAVVEGSAARTGADDRDAPGERCTTGSDRGAVAEREAAPTSRTEGLDVPGGSACVGAATGAGIGSEGPAVDEGTAGTRCAAGGSTGPGAGAEVGTAEAAGAVTATDRPTDGSADPAGSAEVGTDASCTALGFGVPCGTATGPGAAAAGGSNDCAGKPGPRPVARGGATSSTSTGAGQDRSCARSWVTPTASSEKV